MEPPCRAAKARVDRSRLSDGRDAPLECSGCGDTLTPRSWRSGDELGRWCRKSACRGRRREARAALADIDLATQVELLNNVIDLLAMAVQCDAEDCTMSRRVTCFECGLTSALLGWVHPGDARFGSACTGTLDGAPPRRLNRDAIIRAWPFELTFYDAAQIETLKEMG